MPAVQPPETGPGGPVAVLHRLLDGIAQIFKVLATLCLAVMVGLNLFNVISRSTVGVAYGWIFSWTLLLFVWMLLLGFFVYVRTRRDVVVDIFMTRLPAIPRRIAGLFACVVGAAVMLAILRGAPALLSMQASRMEAIDLPIYVRSAPLFVAAGLVLAHFVLDFISIATGTRPAFPRPEEPVEQGAVE
ncbi:MAG: TRAP transporter small permease [Tropicimonas sp.]|uniref:TRAP transporter small permease n=1 Tax=Tropicimonas sp. TaxID=2067044 RepID=UPI003A89A97B